MANPPQDPLFLVKVAIEPQSAGDGEKLAAALGELAAEDPAFGFHIDPESGLTIIKGPDERRLDEKIHALFTVYGVAANIGQPQVAYRETIGRRAEIDYTHKKQAGGGGEFARVKLVFAPTEPDTGFQFESAVVGGAVPEEFIPGVEKGIASAKEDGLLAGFPVIDFRATLIDGAYHDVDSSVLAFEIASRAAFRELRERASPKLLEPIMRVEVVTPEDYLGSVIGDLNSRRGMIQSQDMRGNATVVTAFVPLANMFGYAPAVLVLSQGRAQARMAYSHYSPVPRDDEPDPRFPGAMAMRA